MRARYAVGVDVGGTHIATGLMQRDGVVVAKTHTLTPRDDSGAILEAIIGAIGETVEAARSEEIAGIGIGLPAQMDFVAQSVEWCTNLPLAGVEVRSLVASGTGQPVILDNDGHCAAIGESRYGAAKGVSDFVMITLGTGVGGALFLDGETYRGSRGLAGEIGHMVVRQGGELCPCGGRGHLEAYLGSAAIANNGRVAARTPSGDALRAGAGGDPERVSARTVVESAAAGDTVARDILRDAGEILGEALVGIVNLLNPRLIVVGGGIGESAPTLVARAAEVIAEQALEGRRDVEVVQALLSNAAGVLGAAALAFDEYDRRTSGSNGA